MLFKEEEFLIDCNIFNWGNVLKKIKKTRWGWG